MDARQAIRAEHGAAILEAIEISESPNGNRRERQPLWLTGIGSRPEGAPFQGSAPCWAAIVL